MKNKTLLLFCLIAASVYSDSVQSHKELSQLLFDYYDAEIVNTNSPPIDIGRMHDDLYSYCLTGWMTEPEIGVLAEILKQHPDPRFNSFLMACMKEEICSEGNLLEALSGSATQEEVNFLSVILVERLFAFKDLDSPPTAHLWNFLFNVQMRGELDFSSIGNNLSTTFTNPDKTAIAVKLEDALQYLVQIEAEEQSKIGKPNFSDVEEGAYKEWLLALQKENGGEAEIYKPTPQEFKQTLNQKFRVYLQNNGLYPESILMKDKMKNDANQKPTPTVITPIESGDNQGA
jgi:hypothetical protein